MTNRIATADGCPLGAEALQRAEAELVRGRTGRAVAVCATSFGA